MEAQFHKIVSGEDTGLIARLVRPVLAAVELPYHLAVAARNQGYDSGLLHVYRPAVPVVSVGNLTLGGTGKTPFVECVCRWFLDRGNRPVILSRGYGRVDAVESSSRQLPENQISTSQGRGLDDSTQSTHEFVQNDESLLLRANLPGVPHRQGKDRVELARRAIDEFRPDVLVLDDGFQHRRLARDLDIVLIDCTGPFGYGRLFPRGLLREPITSLRRADLIVLTRSELCSETDREQTRETVRATTGPKPILCSRVVPTRLWSQGNDELTVDTLRGQTVAAFCGIGNPPAFYETLQRIGCEIVATREFPDHHRYDDADLASLAKWAGTLRPDAVLTTQKDIVKIAASELGGCPLLALCVEAVVDDPNQELERALVGVLRNRPDSAAAA